MGNFPSLLEASQRVKLSQPHDPDLCAFPLKVCRVGGGEGSSPRAHLSDDIVLSS